MDFQSIIVFMVVLIAIAYAGRGLYSKTAGMFARSDCGTNCGCGDNSKKRTE